MTLKGRYNIGFHKTKWQNGHSFTRNCWGLYKKSIDFVLICLRYYQLNVGMNSNLPIENVAFLLISGEHHDEISWKFDYMVGCLMFILIHTHRSSLSTLPMLYLPFNVYLDSKRVSILIEAVWPTLPMMYLPFNVYLDSKRLSILIEAVCQHYQWCTFSHSILQSTIWLRWHSDLEITSLSIQLIISA